jgi:hypothetical protein
MLEPAVPAYLNSTYAAKRTQRGGTLIAADVTDLATHRERVAGSDEYRPQSCGHCGRKPHVLDIRSRKLRDQPGTGFEDIRRYRCRGCRAVWQVLPACVARCLHRSWGAIQSQLVAAGQLVATGAEWRVRLKPTTVRRWVGRLESSAIVLTQALTEAGALSQAILKELGIKCTRLKLVEALARHGITTARRKLEELAGLLHRVAPGLRLM